MRSGLLILAVLASLLTGCAGMKPTIFLHPEYNFGYIEKVAVIPFENLSKEQGAASRATRLFVSELLATESFEVVEPGEVSRALEKFATIRAAQLTQAQLVEIGKQLGVQALFLGSVNESSSMRSGSASTSVVTMVVRLVETDQGVTVWSATHTEGGRGFWASLFGTGQKSESEVTRNCVKKTLKTLIN
jgi:TolB-like protein